MRASGASVDRCAAVLLAARTRGVACDSGALDPFVASLRALAKRSCRRERDGGLRAAVGGGLARGSPAFARFLPAGLTLEEALAIEKRTGLARTSLRRLRGLLRDLDRGEALWVDPDGGQQRKVRELEDLLHASAQILFDGRVIDEAESLAVLDSPRLRVSQFAQVVHPARLRRLGIKSGFRRRTDPRPGTGLGPVGSHRLVWRCVGRATGRNNLAVDRQRSDPRPAPRCAVSWHGLVVRWRRRRWSRNAPGWFGRRCGSA